MVAEEFTQSMSIIKQSEMDTLNKLKNIVALHVNITSLNPDGMASLNNDWMHLEEQLDYYLELRINYENNFRSILKAGIQNKEIENKNVEVMLFSMLSTLRSLYLWIPNKEDIDLKILNTELSNVLINGINK